MFQLFHLENEMHPKQRQAPLKTPLLLLLLLAALGSTLATRAQTSATVSKSAEISAFAGFTNSASDYGIQRNNGVTVGADYTRFLRWPIAPSIEVRGSYTSGLLITEESILAGLRLEAPFKRRYHPYVDVLYGGTKVLFKFPPTPTYTTDQTSAISLGGGINIDIVRNFQLKLDYQRQFENFGPNGIQPNNADFTLTPGAYTLGVVYRIPFKARQGYR
jgi:hypothetical protein